MSRYSRTYDDVPCTNTGDIDTPLQGVAEARAKHIDKCWCGFIKHSDKPLCNICIRVNEVDNG